ncbi:MAG: hypothetical protein HY828_18615 [Actinobacteria bacterium]|nr:hypothetical protein [Actinomycetota bacterium]
MTDPSRLARLNAIKLTTLVREHIGVDAEFVPGEFPGGAALRHGDDAWVLLADRPDRGRGAALAWALRQGAGTLHVVAESGTGLLARRAEHFAVPVVVWHAEGRVLLPAVPEPLLVPPPVPAAHREFLDVIVDSGAVPHEEFGVLSGEVRGLEVCRVVDDPYLHATRLEVGVGVHDREAFAMLHGDQPAPVALARVVEAVLQHRGGGATGHPLSRLAQERLLRARLVDDPSLIGATAVELAQPPVPRTNLKDPVPCVAVATIGGERVAVVCSMGVDLDAVPYAVDARTAVGLERCMLVVPTRDAIPVQQLLADAVRPPVTIVPVD